MKTDSQISDNDFHILQGKKIKKPFYKKTWFGTVVFVVLLVAFFAFIVVVIGEDGGKAVKVSTEVSKGNAGSEKKISPKQQIKLNQQRAVVVREATSNGYNLRILSVVGCKPELHVGPVDREDTTILLAVRAADVRQDNGEPAGAFVDKGKLLSQGKAKKGFCAIIDDNIIIGAAENSPYLEEAINNEGYFFRQYPLVVDGMAIHNKPRGSSIRRALCEKEGEIMVIDCEDVSFNDFAQALEDFGVTNAIYLVGGSSYGYYRTMDLQRHDFGDPNRNSDPMISFLIWR